VCTGGGRKWSVRQFFRVGAGNTADRRSLLLQGGFSGVWCWRRCARGRLGMPNGMAACSGIKDWGVGWVFRADVGTVTQRCLLLREDGNGVWCWWRCAQKNMLRCVITWWFRAQCLLLRAVKEHGRGLHGRYWGGVVVRGRGYFPVFNNVPIYCFPIL